MKPAMRNCMITFLMFLFHYNSIPVKTSLTPNIVDNFRWEISQSHSITDVIMTKEIVKSVVQLPAVNGASSICTHTNWNYSKKGNDWKCLCKQGKKQSPINLPLKGKAILSPVRPMFYYNVIKSLTNVDSLKGFLNQGDPVKIRYENGAVRISHPNFGKIITLDKGIYIAKEISFHSPSEHTINGVYFDLEMHVIHHGMKDHSDKKIVLSFLFKKSPDQYNKFFSSIDFFNLPNPVETVKGIKKPFYIPDVIQTGDMNKFSFYTYEGSITEPPCTENTMHYVSADPIALSYSAIIMFKEALMDLSQLSKFLEESPYEEEYIENNRRVMNLERRDVFIFDYEKFGTWNI